MKNNVYIRNFLGAWLLAIFVLSNTPIKVLHYLFADHTDVHTLLFDHDNHPQIQTAGIDCHYDSNVVITPYMYAIPVQSATSGHLSNEHFIVANEQFTYISPIGFKHRGPPALG